MTAPAAVGGARGGELVIDAVTVEYPSGDYVVRPLDGFSARIPDGALALLLGPSGCGKTTLLSCLAGILTPDAGAIRHGATEVTALHGSGLTRYRRHGVGLVFQAFNLVPSLTALENVVLPLRCAGTGVREARRRARELLEQVGLGERAHHHPDRLSGGQQQRVAIARALALDPPLLLADEPTAHLDYVQVESTLRLLRGLAQPGRVVVIVTHDDRLLPLADQVVELVPHRAPDAGVPTGVDLADGATLFRQGDPSDVVYVVEAGCIVIQRELSDGTTDELRRVGPGGFFGEMGPLFGLPRSATAVAAGQTHLTGYPVAAFKDYLGVDGLEQLIGRPATAPSAAAPPEGAAGASPQGAP